MSPAANEDVLDLVEIERCALNEAFTASGRDWFWDTETHATLRRVGGIKRQLDEYGYRIADLLNYDQLVALHNDTVRRMESKILERRSEQPHQAWVA